MGQQRLSSTGRRPSLWILSWGAALAASLVASAEVRLITPAGYLPNIPFLARIEVRDQAGKRDWQLWDAEAVLSADDAGVKLSTNRVTLRNGLGTALILIQGSVDFTLTASVERERTTRSIRHWGNQPISVARGILPGAATTWSGIVQVTGDVTVPASHTLTIASNTIVLLNGVASGTAGADILVNGTLQSLGTEDHPVTITCADPNLNWGQIRHANAALSTYRHTFITKAGRAPGEGHTGTGPALRPSNSTITFESCVISDLTAGGSTIGKIMQASGSDVTFRDCVLARARMGPEIGGTGLLCEDTYILEMTGPDDSDGIYLHSAAGRSMTLRGCVLAAGTDDAVDTLDSNVLLENCLMRDWPNPSEDAKGVSVFHGEVQLRRCLIVNCFAGVSAKSSGPPATVRMDQCTVVGIAQGVSAAFKSNATAGNVAFYMTNSIVVAADAVHSDFGPEKFVSVQYCTLSEPWPGVGNLATDPGFANAAAGDYRLLPNSPCLDAGDPSSPRDPDGSRADIGYFTGQALTSGLFVSLTSPAAGALFAAPTNLALVASAQSVGGTVTRVEFFEGDAKLGEAASSPYSMVWRDVRPGQYHLRALAADSLGRTATSAPASIVVTPGDGPSTNILVTAGSVWKYLDDGTDQGTAWTQPVFNDSPWRSGRAELGYGDGDEATVLGFGPSASNKYPTYYFRQTFVVDDPARVERLELSLLRDDGAIVYLNGQEATRVSMPAGPVTFRTFATTASEYSWEISALSPTLLVAGTNVVAVEVHQGNATSSDLSFDLELRAVLSRPANARPLVAIVSPTAGAIFSAPAQVIIDVTAADPDGTVAQVALHANEQKLADLLNAPYRFVWENVPAGPYSLTAVATDATGLSSVSTAVNVVVSTNTGPPRVASQLPPPGAATNLTEVTVTFSKPVAGVDAADLLINGVAASSVAGSGTQYKFAFLPPAPGLGVVSWASQHGITDTFTPRSAFDHLAPEASWQYQIIDSEPPSLKDVTPPPRSTVSALDKIVVTFSEAVNGVDAGDLLINSVPATAVTGSGAGPYTFSFPPPASGTVLMEWARAHGIRDQAGNALGGLSWSYTLDPASVGIVISEIMYHPASENSLEEYVELHNRDASPVNLKGWRFNNGVAMKFGDVIIPAGGYWVAAADLAAFQRKYPSVTNVSGNWTGTLSNSRETIELVDAQGRRMDRVRYADEGDWAVRRRSLPDRNRRGWVWDAEHDGRGKSLELINPDVSNNEGQNWAASRVTEGTPGRVNSMFASRPPPLIRNVVHAPAVPLSTDLVRVSAQVVTESSPVAKVTLSYRVDGPSPGPFAAVPMRDDGAAGDASKGDGIFTAVLPAQANNAIVEFFVTAADESGQERTWPAPVREAADGAGPFGQVANALYQVDDTRYTGSQPLYKFILTASDRAVLQAIHDNVGGAANSDAQMNATFISIDGAGTEVRYLTGVRNRGHGTRTARPNNLRVNFRSDDEWKGVTALNLNAQFSWLQVLGAALHVQSGMVGGYSRAVQVRVNNVNLTTTGVADRSYGSYAANEAINGDWADRHFPGDSEGNVYRALRDLVPSDFDYRTQAAYPGLRGPEDKNSYTNTWFKTTNVTEDDWTDLFTLLRVFGPNGTEPFTPANVRRVLNAEQWLRHLAIMNLLGNSETGLNSGYNDDYFMYRGRKDTRFILMYYDLDQILGFNGAFASNSQLFSSGSVGNLQRAGPAFGRFLRHPEFEPIYYAALRELIETSFAAPQFNALVDDVLGDFVPAAVRQQIKNWMDARRAYVASQLPAVAAAIATPLASVTGAPRETTSLNTALLQIGGIGVTHYRYKLNGGAFGPEASVAVPITLTALPSGTNRIAVIGKDAAGRYQAENDATVTVWVVQPAWPGVRLNEIIARPRQNAPDQIELYNEGSSVVNLEGMRLTDDPAMPAKFTFGRAILASGSYLVLEAAQLGFALDASGEGVYLFDSEARSGAQLDAVEFGLQIEGFSIGRIGNGREWRLTQPTFGSANVLQPLGDARKIKINEWLAAISSSDFLELYNPETLPVALGGCYLTDHPAGVPKRSPIAPLSFIPAESYLVFASGNGNRADEFAFGLSADQGQIALLAPDLTVVDAVVYGPQQMGISSGRCPDGSVGQKALPVPTPGGPNQCPLAPPAPGIVTLLAFDHAWKYDATGPDRGAAWRAADYDDSAWDAGPGLIGFEEAQLPEPLRTRVASAGSRVTFYFRTQFQFDPGLSPVGLQVTHVIDDGAAFYLNGQPVGTRFNLPANAGFQTLASGSVGDAGYQTFTMPADPLRPGRNVLAVEVHQASRTSTDMVFGLRLDALVEPKVAGQQSVIINEVLASNASASGGTARDWIELYNPSASPVDLAGMSLTDTPANPRRWTFPRGSVVPARGFLRVLCGAGAGALPAEVTFGLNAQGGPLFLFKRTEDGGQIQDSVSYGLQAEGWSIGRVPDGGTNWVLNRPTPAEPNAAALLGQVQRLKINEWMAAPAAGDDWFEIVNPDSAPVELSGFWLSDSLTDLTKHQLPKLSFLGHGPNGYQRFVADENSAAGSDHVSFKLSASGEALAISSPDGVLIDGVSFGPQAAGVSQGRLPDGGAAIVSFPRTSTPGESNYLPIEAIVINELLSHTDPPLEDAVELHNASDRAVDVSGWFLSDSSAQLRKFPIPPSSIISAGGYLVLYEYQFNSDATGPAFAFSSAKGDAVFLSQAENGELTGYRSFAAFGPAQNGVSFGRFPTSQGVHFVPMAQRTFGQDNPGSAVEFRKGQGAPNAYAKVGPVVITEIMYHPPGGGSALEFVELHNVSAASVPLFDPVHPTNTWRLRKGIDFDFPPGTSLPAGSQLVVVSFDPKLDSSALAGFQAAYGSHAVLVGPYRGALENRGETIELQKPDAPQALPGPDFGLVPYLLADRVDYASGLPWPASASGAGHSLQKTNPMLYGNDPAHWIAAAPNPGALPGASANDSDQDGLPDDWEKAHQLNPQDASDAGHDSDGDGMSNLQEYWAGTDPRNPASLVRISFEFDQSGQLRIGLVPVAGRSYVLEYRDSFQDGSWQTFEVISPVSEQRLQMAVPMSASTRFFRIRVAPSSP